MKRIRLYNSDLFQHLRERMKITATNEEGRRQCALCSKAKVTHGTRYQCTICKVPLCIKPIQDNPCCFDLWHTTFCDGTTLQSLHTQLSTELKEGREERKEAREAALATAV